MAAFLIAAVCAFSAEKPEKAEKFAIKYGPYVHSLYGDEAVITWITNRPAVSWVETAPNDGTHFYAYERPKFFNSPMGKKLVGTVHSVRLKNISKPVRYRVLSAEVTGRDGEKVVYGDYAGSDVYRGKPFLLRPIPNSSEKVKFAVVNDIHADSQRLSDLLSRAPKDIEFLVLNGDMVSRMDSERQIFDGFMSEIVKFTGSEMPVYFARGNHEARGEFSEEFLKYFPTPTGKPYYSFKWGNACFVMLDAGEDKPDSDIEYFSTADFDAYRREQAEWFAELIKNEDFKGERRPQFKRRNFEPTDNKEKPRYNKWHKQDDEEGKGNSDKERPRRKPRFQADGSPKNALEEKIRRPYHERRRDEDSRRRSADSGSKDQYSTTEDTERSQQRPTSEHSEARTNRIIKFKQPQLSADKEQPIIRGRRNSWRRNDLPENNENND